MDPQEALSILDQLEAEAVEAIKACPDSAAVRDAEVRFTGRKSNVAEVGRALGSFDADSRSIVGKRSNAVRAAITDAMAARLHQLEDAESAARLVEERIDVTLPGRRPPSGAIHPLTEVADEIVDTFIGLGFNVVEGPIVETDYYNFEALNIPKDHAARSMHDTLYVDSPKGETLLIRTHTSPMQIRIMESTPPPIYVIVPGVVGRNEEVNANSLAIFNQIEGLAVDEGIRFSDLKGTLERFARATFGERLTVRMHPSYFPFTEPSAEVYVSCFNCDGSGCPTCRGEGWIEIMGAGMVHPNVLRGVGIDPERYTGFAFGMGIERIAKLKYSVNDVRSFYENDLRLLEALR